VEVTSPVSYEVETDRGLVKRHIDQIRKRFVDGAECKTQDQTVPDHVTNHDVPVGNEIQTETPRSITPQPEMPQPEMPQPEVPVISPREAGSSSIASQASTPSSCASNRSRPDRTRKPPSYLKD